jgi:hypothetical protein
MYKGKGIFYIKLETKIWSGGEGCDVETTKHEERKSEVRLVTFPPPLLEFLPAAK